MNCPRCGCFLQQNQKKCSKCKAPSTANTHKATTSSVLSPALSEQVPDRYASFPERAMSGVLDAIFLAVVETVLICTMNFLFPLERDIWTILTHTTLPFVVSFLYYPLLESSMWQATLGKRFIGLMVTDIKGSKLSIVRALFKQALQAVTGALLFGTIIFLCSTYSFHSTSEPTGLLFAGIFVANLLYFALHCAIVFTEKKQSVFDKLTGRLVYKHRRASDLLQPSVIEKSLSR